MPETHPQDFVKAKHCLLQMAGFSLLFFGKTVNLITVEPDELSGIIEMDIHVVLCSKHPQAKILPKKIVCPFPVIKRHYFPTVRLWAPVP